MTTGAAIALTPALSQYPPTASTRLGAWRDTEPRPGVSRYVLGVDGLGGSTMVKLGTNLPEHLIGTDHGALAEFLTGIEELGYGYITIGDHVLGADLSVRPDWKPYLGKAPLYDQHMPWHDPLVLFGFLTALTTTLEMSTGILIAPQRQAALLAKQAAEVDILTQGRFRLGIGAGWNPVEYEALGQDFPTRGKRQEEQIGLLRRLWTERSLTHEGTFDRIVGAGLAPLPAQRPIPIWIGGMSAPAYRRIGRLAEGWFPRVEPGPDLDEARAIITSAATEAGRDPAAIGMDGRVRHGAGGTDDLLRDTERWRAAGATHVSVDTMGSGLPGLDAHLDALATAAGALHLSRPT
jgi:probable F420-dependent oxidoreductase